jgi:cation-transporting ATPase 13A1
MEKTTLEAMKWGLGKGDIVSPLPAAAVNGNSNTAAKTPQIAIKRRFQFSSALKRMSTVSVVSGPSTPKRTFVAVKGAPETLKKMYTKLPENYESTYKWFAQRGSRVLALGYKFMDVSSESQVFNCKLSFTLGIRIH